MYIVNKPSGWTLKKLLEDYYINNSHLSGLTYAGRLDPLAEGVMILIDGTEQEKKQEILALPKVYDLSILFGFSSDTYDVLGITKADKEAWTNIDSLLQKDKLEAVLQSYIGKKNQTYPPYSSKTIQGKPMWLLARQDKLPEKLPVKEVEIYAITFLESKLISSKDLLKQVGEKISQVEGDFRQTEALKSWQRLLAKSKPVEFPIITIRVHCSSGTYMRSLANDLGKRLNNNALAWHIKRISVGNYSL